MRLSAAVAASIRTSMFFVVRPDGTRRTACEDADGCTLMLNGTWAHDPLQAGGWKHAAEWPRGTARKEHLRSRQTILHTRLTDAEFIYVKAT